ncbi:MAG: stress response translation initiation inhibitor YciH [Thermofilum sp. ex4484_82]|nr:stress response translation initiation inhibitor YciH [Thermoproteales archaeon]OYT28035.1 MAG: stress response translation initiation inhibitor YciH [Thermofilum sp. ex4484_82]OYT38201.1 MAG: stress response translation initiation inhibitor YciH [Archaeoglobales archaeon ex4484_92]RLE85950.1 MAG: stress response translation initiation inhibitor YciH [Thermoprotei archaeon]
MSVDLLDEIFKDVFRDQQLIKIRLERRRRRKEVTILEGFDDKNIDIYDLATKLKSKLACGGTTKNGRIELQGDHRYRAREILIELGFNPDSILVE